MGKDEEGIWECKKEHSSIELLFCQEKLKLIALFPHGAFLCALKQSMGEGKSACHPCLLVIPRPAGHSGAPLHARSIQGSGDLPSPFCSSRRTGTQGENSQLSPHLPVCRHLLHPVASAAVLWGSRQSKKPQSPSQTKLARTQCGIQT